MKKAFTLFELIITILIASIITSLSYTYYAQNRWLSDVNKMNKNIFYLLDNGVMNTVTGYINGTGGDCSNNNDYTDLSAARMIDCVGYNGTYPYSGTKSTDGTQSYLTNFLKNHTKNANGCKLYLDDKSSNEFYMFLDCSNINYDNGSNRAKKYIEQKVNAYMKINFSTIYQSADTKSTAINNNSGGTDDDGKIRILFKK